MTNKINDPHQGQPLSVTGSSPDEAAVAMVMIHGRGATADSILTLAAEFSQPEFAYLAPQAVQNAWYPNRFLAPLESNEPYLSSALAVLGRLMDRLAKAGIPSERTILLGFSQGACLALEFAARHAQRFGGVVGLSGGLIGPDGTPRDYPGALENTPIFLGCSDVDFHIPKERVDHSAEVLRGLGGQVTKRLYPGMGHTVNHDEINFVRAMMKNLAEPTLGKPGD